MTVDQKTMAELLQLGGQYLLPIAALLRAIYSGMRGKFPEGFAQIAVASLFAGLTAPVGSAQLDIRTVALAILGNSTFVAGLLSFTMIYLLRMAFRSFVFDGIVGGVIGLISWVIMVSVLGNNWPWWTIPLAIAAGAAGFIVLRILLRQIFRLVRIATYFIVAGVGLALIGGGILLFQTLFAR
jgi:hypothetical protein